MIPKTKNKKCTGNLLLALGIGHPIYRDFSVYTIDRVNFSEYKKKQTMHYDRSKQVLAGGENDE